VTKTIEQEALDLINEVARERGHAELKACISLRKVWLTAEAFCRAIEQLLAEREAHAATKAEYEASRQEVSDAVEEWVTADRRGPEPRRRASEKLTTFIIPKPKPDPVVEAIRDMALTDATQEDADRLRAALAARGLKLVEAGDAAA